MLWPQTLDDPPLPVQLRFWARARSLGRRRYVCLGILVVTFVILVMWVTAKIVAFWPFGKELDFSTFEILALGPILGWLIVRDQWTKNEQIYAKNTGPHVESKSEK
jgi:hypothetical protein